MLTTLETALDNVREILGTHFERQAQLLRTTGTHELTSIYASNFNMTSTSLHYRHILAVFCLLASFAGCQVLEPPSKSFDQSLTSLSQFQLAFVDNYTAAPGKLWDDAKFREDINKGEAMFSSAMAGVADQKRLKALDILHRQFQEDYTFLETRAKEGKPFFSVAAAQQKKILIEQNYDLAKKGELARS